MRYKSRLTLVALVAILSLAFFRASFAKTVADPDPHRFDQEIQAFRDWDAKNAIPKNHVLFVGSSSIRLWKSAELFPDLPIVNRGFGGAHISDMIYFKEAILLKYGAPACIVMFCGSNDVAAEKSVDQVIVDFMEWQHVVHENFPATPLVFIPITPCPSRWKIWGEMEKVNAGIKKMCDDNPLLYYADTASQFLATGKPPAAELFQDDMLHLSDKGYQIWVNTLRPMLEEILK